MKGARIAIAGVSRIYGAQRALDKLDLSIAPGEWLAVMGPSGSGKTTLLNLLGGLDRPDEGTVLVDTLDLAGLDDTARTRYRRERVGLVFQQFHLLPYLDSLENVMVAQHYHSLADPVEALEALRRVGLEHKAKARPGQLSGGEQQRVCIARALINQPALILADEPTGNLDEDNARAVLDLFSALHRAGHTIVLVTHDPDVAALADRTSSCTTAGSARCATRPPSARSAATIFSRKCGISGRTGRLRCWPRSAPRRWRITWARRTRSSSAAGCCATASGSSSRPRAWSARATWCGATGSRNACSPPPCT
jgi:putative ABC transport system ATP-binding protein